MALLGRIDLTGQTYDQGDREHTWSDVSLLLVLRVFPWGTPSFSNSCPFPFSMQGVPARWFFSEAILTQFVVCPRAFGVDTMEQPRQLATPEETFAALQAQFDFSNLITSEDPRVGVQGFVLFLLPRPG